MTEEQKVYRCGIDCPNCPYLDNCLTGKDFMNNWEEGFNYHDGECSEEE